MFGSLRVVDFLADVYRASGIDPYGKINLNEVKDLLCNGGISGDVASSIASLASQRAAGKLLSTDFNSLNMSWYDNHVTRISVCPSGEECYDTMLQKDCRIFVELSRQIQRDFAQTRMLNQDLAGLSGSLLLQRSRQISKYSKILHNIASQMGIQVFWNGKNWSCSDFQNQNECSGELSIPVNDFNEPQEVVIESERYMWGSGWKYVCPDKLECGVNKWKHYRHVVHEIVEGLCCLYQRTPVNSILRELIWHLRKQAKCLEDWLCKARHHCVKYEKECKKNGIPVDEEYPQHGYDSHHDHQPQAHHGHGHDHGQEETVDRSEPYIPQATVEWMMASSGSNEPHHTWAPGN